MKPEITILQGDNRERMKAFESDSFHAIVTDPPYELGFMGKKWDSSGIAYDPVVWSEALRVLKPGGWLMAFGGSRTYHRLACAIEDAGFEVRDMIEWIYGSGFPKSLDISKALDKAAGADRKTIATIKKSHIGGSRKNTNEGWQRPSHYDDSGEAKRTMDITEACTQEARKWDGWGTALKPAHEPICLARKPVIGTVVENVLQHGCGGLNIAAGRIDAERVTGWGGSGSRLHDGGLSVEAGEARPVSGRFPANLILDSEAAVALDEQSGQLTSGIPSGLRQAKNKIYGDYAGGIPVTGFGDSGGASRFFYTAKASGSDRGNKTKGALPLFGVEEEEFRNTHPTVKPLALMTYLLKLVCRTELMSTTSPQPSPPFHGGEGDGRTRVLDPFAGSGTTLVACKQLGIDCVGIELLEEHCAIIRERCGS